MKKVLKTLLVTAISCSLFTGAMVQAEEQQVKKKTVTTKAKERAKKEKMMPAPEVQLKRLSTGLKLTDEQQKQIKPLLDEEYAKLKEIMQDENLSPKQIQKQVEELRTGTIAKMQSHMTPEQVEKHNLISKEIKANKQKRIKENRKARIGTKADPPKQPKQD
jgi:hypothetical protein